MLKLDPVCVKVYEDLLKECRDLLEECRKFIAMEGFPESPCEKCKKELNCRACDCSCHKNRVTYFEQERARLLGKLGQL